MKRTALVLGFLVAVGLLSVAVSRILIAHAAAGKTFSDVTQLPHRHVGLVLGCPPMYRGLPNPFFVYRMDAAAELFHSGKVDYLLLSGDHRRSHHDEPTEMKRALLARGVPAEKIYLDYAGLRTLDSVVRAKEIFGQDSVTIVSQRFHNQRAIFLASHRGLDAIGFNARDVGFPAGLPIRIREQFAKVKAVLDIYLLNKKPHFLGAKTVIGS
jgi:SanA protein